MTFRDVIGPDVSFYQDAPDTPQQIDFRKMRSAGAYFVIIRAGQNNWEDEDFKYNWREAKAAGLPRGAYFFYDDRVSPDAQAVLFWSLVVQDPPEIGLWLDLEKDYGGSYRGWGNWKKCLDKLRSLTSGIGIYTGPHYWMTHRPTGAADLAYFKSFPLWIAHYGVIDPLIPSPWTSCLFWQYGTPAVGEQFGVESKEIDMNIFNGDVNTFRNYFSLTEIPDDGEEGTTMARYEATSIYSMSRRSEPNVDNTPLGSIPAQSKMHGDILIGEQGSGDCWLHLTDINGQPTTGYVAIEHAGRVYCSLVDNQPPAPQPDERPTAMTLEWEKDGVIVKSEKYSLTYLPE